MAELRSKFIRICREGATTDGRTITREQIDEMASNYNPETYGARIWLEHFRSLLPDGLFPALGDVTALRAEDDRDGRRVLLAQLSPTTALLEMNKKKQKVYTSIEMDPLFGDTNQAYLVGLAVTDSPASLGTEMLCFSQKHRNEFKKGSELTENIFSEPLATDGIDFDEDGTLAEEKPNLLTRIKKILSGQQKNQEQALQDMESSLLAIAESQQEWQSRSSGIQALESAVAGLETQMTELSARLGKQPDNDRPQRPTATGAAAITLTDC